MIGVDALVPPTSIQPGAPNVSRTTTPVAGSATAATSFKVRLWQRFMSESCHDGLASPLEHPEAVPSVALVRQTDSAQPRPPARCLRCVPPMEVTYCSDAGNV